MGVNSDMDTEHIIRYITWAYTHTAVPIFQFFLFYVVKIHGNDDFIGLIVHQKTFGGRLQELTWNGSPSVMDVLRYDTIRLTVLTCAQKLTSSQLNLPHGTEQKE